MPASNVSRVRSVPEYLRRRYDYRAHVLNSATFLVVTILMVRLWRDRGVAPEMRLSAAADQPSPPS